jgi:hypothetical protein
MVGVWKRGTSVEAAAAGTTPPPSSLSASVLLSSSCGCRGRASDCPSECWCLLPATLAFLRFGSTFNALSPHDGACFSGDVIRLRSVVCFFGDVNRSRIVVCFFGDVNRSRSVSSSFSSSLFCFLSCIALLDLSQSSLRLTVSSKALDPPSSPTCIE